MCKHHKTLINEVSGFTLWCGHCRQIQLCYNNLVIWLTFNEMNHFMDALEEVEPVYQREAPEGTGTVYILRTPVTNIFFAFSAKEKSYLFELCHRSLRLARAIEHSN